MKRDEVIERLQNILDEAMDNKNSTSFVTYYDKEALRTAIKTLQHIDNDGWIPVKERLPRPLVDVWCYSDMGYIVGYYDERINTWYSDRGDYRELIVVAWMPLPEYKEG